MRITSGNPKPQRKSAAKRFLPFLLILLDLHRSGTRAATIVHGNGQVASAISHQSFTRLSSPEPLILQHSQQQQQLYNPQQLLVPSARIVNHQGVQPVERFFQAAQEVETEEQHLPGQTPAHLTYAARPVVHQMLPRIKPVRNISFASLLPGPRSLSTNYNVSPV